MQFIQQATWQDGPQHVPASGPVGTLCAVPWQLSARERQREGRAGRALAFDVHVPMAELQWPSCPRCAWNCTPSTFVAPRGTEARRPGKGKATATALTFATLFILLGNSTIDCWTKLMDLIATYVCQMVASSNFRASGSVRRHWHLACLLLPLARVPLVCLGHLSVGWYVMATACHFGGVRG